MVLQEWGRLIAFSLQQGVSSVINFLPQLIGALVIFGFGWLVAVVLGQVVAAIVRSLKIDTLLTRLEINKSIEKAGWKLDSGAFMGALVKWFLIIVFLLAAANILGLTQVSDFLRDVLLYLPNVVVASLILIIAAFVAEAAERILRGSARMMGAQGAFVGAVARWAIWIFAIVAVLLQLGIAVTLVQTLITGLVAAIAIGGGIAFGLGGRDAAADLIRKIQDDFCK